MRKLFGSLILLLSINFGLHAAPGPNEVCVNNDITYSNVNLAFQFLNSGDVIYFHEQTYDWTYAQIRESCEIDGIADKSIAELNMSNLSINGTGAITVTIKDMIFRGGGEISVGPDDHVVFQNCTFENTAYNQVDASGGSSNWSNVEFTDCVFNRTGSVGQNIRFYGDFLMDNCNLDEIIIYASDYNAEIRNCTFNACEVNNGGNGNSSAIINSVLIENCSFVNSELQIKGTPQYTVVRDVQFSGMLVQPDFYFYGDTVLIDRFDTEYSSTFQIGYANNKNSRYTINDVHIGLLVDSWVYLDLADTSIAYIDSLVVDSCASSANGIYTVGGGAQAYFTNCSIVSGRYGFRATNALVEFENCHSRETSLSGFEFRNGKMDRCSALGCDFGFKCTNVTGSIFLSNSIFADNLSDGIFLSWGSTAPEVDLEFVNNTIDNNVGHGFYAGQTTTSTVRPMVYFYNNISTNNGDVDFELSYQIRNAEKYEMRNNMFSNHWADYTGYKHMGCVWDEDEWYFKPYFDESANGRLNQLRPLKNSAAVNAGLDVGYGIYDFSFDGATFREYGTAVDIGAQEFDEDANPYLILSTPEPFWEGSEDGQVISVEIVNAEFDTVLDVSNWSLTGNIPVASSGHFEIGSVLLVDSTHAEVTLSGSVPYLVWPLFRNQYNLGISIEGDEIDNGTSGVQGVGITYLKAGVPIPYFKESYRFHDQTNLMYSFNGSEDIMVTTDNIDNVIEFNVEVPATGIYGFEWRYNAPSSLGMIDRIYEDDNLIMVQNESPFTIGSWANQTMELFLTNGFHRIKFHISGAGTEIESVEFKDIITGSEELEASSIQVYPVPMKDELIIDSEHEVSSYELRGMNGNILRSGTSSSINTKSLVSGAYILKVVTPEGFVVKKVIK